MPPVPYSSSRPVSVVAIAGATESDAVAAAACASMGLIGALISFSPSHNLRYTGLMLVILFSIIGAFFAGCGFTVDFIVWTLLRTRLSDPAIGRSAHLGPASYVMVAGTFCSSMAATFAGITLSVEASEPAEV